MTISRDAVRFDGVGPSELPSAVRCRNLGRTRPGTQSRRLRNRYVFATARLANSPRKRPKFGEYHRREIGDKYRGKRVMTACIVGFAHSPFGKLDAETVESLIVRVATDALADAGIEPKRGRRDRARPFQCGLLGAGFHRLAGAAGLARSALQARDAGGECLRHRIGGRASGPQEHRGQGGAHRAGGRCRADDDDARRPRSARIF